jgi:hypothetical protein
MVFCAIFLARRTASMCIASDILCADVSCESFAPPGNLSIYKMNERNDPILLLLFQWSEPVFLSAVCCLF